MKEVGSNPGKEHTIAIVRPYTALQWVKGKENPSYKKPGKENPEKPTKGRKTQKNQQREGKPRKTNKGKENPTNHEATSSIHSPVVGPPHTPPPGRNEASRVLPSRIPKGAMWDGAGRLAEHPGCQINK